MHAIFLDERHCRMNYSIKSANCAIVKIEKKREKIILKNSKITNVKEWTIFRQREKDVEKRIQPKKE